MKDSVGEGAMTIITIVIVSGAIAGFTYIIYNLLNNQNRRANCENAGYSYDGGTCYLSDGTTCKNINSEGTCED